MWKPLWRARRARVIRVPGSVTETSVDRVVEALGLTRVGSQEATRRHAASGISHYVISPTVDGLTFAFTVVVIIRARIVNWIGTSRTSGTSKTPKRDDLRQISVGGMEG